MTTLDLHGFRHQDVEPKLYSFFYENRDSMVKIIIGNSIEMLSIVVDAALSHGFKYSNLISTEVVVWT